MGAESSKEAARSPVDDPRKNNIYSKPIPVQGEDYSKPLKDTKLSSELQSLVDREDSTWDTIYEGHAGESTESNVRYAAYAARVRTILLSAQRYVAYTSDIGESFRPVAHPWLVRSAYGISWAYILGDVSHEGYKAYLRQQSLQYPDVKPGEPAIRATDGSIAGEAQIGKVPALEDWKTVVAQRAVFQSIASMGLPAFTIHSIVRYSGKAMKDVKNVRVRTWGPIGLGLAAVPALPVLFDKPVEEAVEWTFHKAFEAFGGKEAVGVAPSTGREAELKKQTFAKDKKEL
ncbi:MAG: hypothetical protein GOMPHAMPRED_007027 [Gomphillus americanus]|uniref:Mitochondrial fission process protein 1 n=1 Tax=Gomphillus americanus TaxID=1940652 RepID=A0A8H3I7H3_9LECA|nr:MAG: hypothetical protein GOMPHAMPRED_007027 [Gomphillus americanus]